MRFLITAIICSLCAGCASTPKQAVTSIEIKEIKPRYFETEQFKRISEYMTGKEHVGERLILRTQPEHRAGYYFILVLDEDVRRLPPSQAERSRLRAGQNDPLHSPQD